MTFIDKRFRRKRRANKRGQGCAVKQYIRTDNTTVRRYKQIDDSMTGANLTSMRDAMTKPRIDSRYATCNGAPNSQRLKFEPKEIKE